MPLNSCRFIILGVFALTFTMSVFAQDSEDVEINLEVLESLNEAYKITGPEAEPVMLRPPAPQAFAPPLPQHKPSSRGKTHVNRQNEHPDRWIVPQAPVKKQAGRIETLRSIPIPLSTAEEITDSQLETPDVKEILKSIEGVSKSKDENFIVAENEISIGYMPGVTEMPVDLKNDISVQILKYFNQQPGGRIEVRTYASPQGGGATDARRLSLARALDIRDLLINLEISPAQIDIRPLGKNTDRTPLDRADIIFTAL